MEGFHPADILIHLINIVILFVILRAVLLKPVQKFMAERTSRIRAQEENAAAAMAEAETLKASYGEKLAEAEADGRAIVSESRGRAAAEREEALAAAKDEARAIIAAAKEAAEAEKKNAVAASKDEITALAVALAEKILAREVSEEDNRRTVDDFFREMEL